MFIAPTNTLSSCTKCEVLIHYDYNYCFHSMLNRDVMWTFYFLGMMKFVNLDTTFKKRRNRS